jgi:hypothetical protein
VKKKELLQVMQKRWKLLPKNKKLPMLLLKQLLKLKLQR